MIVGSAVLFWASIVYRIPIMLSFLVNKQFILIVSIKKYILHVSVRRTGGLFLSL